MKFHHTDGPHCLYLSTDRNLGSFSSLAIVNMPAKHPSLCCADTESFRNTPKSGMAGSYGCLIFRFLRKLHTAFHGSCTSLRSYRHWARVQFLYILICCLFSWWQPCWLPWVKSPKAALIDMLATFLTVPTVWLSLPARYFTVLPKRLMTSWTAKSPTQKQVASPSFSVWM